ncbi:MAG: FAD-dependent oxidoreductase [Candidatus Eisenbacteria bacterium]|nr:FAD-dependent oxidoreductase [Candidatus Eisenbacteria bacterium]
MAGPSPAKDPLELKIHDHRPNYRPAEAIVEAARCLYCHDAPCVAACPTGIDIPGFIRKISTGNLGGSARTILSANLLGYSCARVCPVEVLCAGACVHHHQGREPIAIGRLQRHAVQIALDQGTATSLLRRQPANGKSVACVGAGPASLACAGYLALEGFKCVVFEKRPLAGGLNTTGVAPYKMHLQDSLREVGLIRDLGVEIRAGVEIGRDVPPGQLLKEHDAVFVGVGLGPDSRLHIPGEDGPGVMGATEWIESLKTEPGYTLPPLRGAVVIGGGNTAIDAARELAHLGVSPVTLAYRRTRDVMPGYRHELAQAHLDGVLLMERAVPAEFARRPDGGLAAVRFADGREIACDLALVAIGQAHLGELLGAFPGIEINERGCVTVDAATGRTGNPKVYAGGDAVNGGDLVVTAVQEGKRAARAICAQLGVTVAHDAPLMAGHR